MPLYTINGKKVRTDKELSDDEIDEIASSISAEPSQPQQTTQPQQAQPYQRQKLSFSNEPVATFDTGTPVDFNRSQITGEPPKDYRASFASQLSKENAATGIETGLQIGGGVLGSLTAPITGAAGPFAGGAAGYAAGRQLTGKLGLREEQPILKSFGEGLAYEVGGRVAGKVLEKGLAAGSKLLGKGAKPAPSVEAIRQESNALREKMYASPQQYDPNALAPEFRSAIENASPRFPVGGKGAEGTQGVLDQLDAIINEHAAGVRPTKVDELDMLRRQINDVINKGGDDARYALLLKKKLDAYVENVGGEAGTAWKQARDLEAQAYRSEDVNKIAAASEAASGATSQELRKRFGAIAADKNQMKFYTPEQQDIINQIANGSATEKTFELIGKMAPKSVTWTRLLSLAGIGGGAAAVGGLPGVVAIGAGLGTGVAARSAANALAKSRVNMLDELIRGGQIPKTIQLPQTAQRLMPAGVNALLSTRSSP
jgi:hypothetical protein